MLYLEKASNACRTVSLAILSLTSEFVLAIMPFSYFEPNGDCYLEDFLRKLDIAGLLGKLTSFEPLSETRQKLCLSRGLLPTSRFPEQRELIRHGVNDRMILGLYNHVRLSVTNANIQLVAVDGNDNIHIYPDCFPIMQAALGRETLDILLRWMEEQVPKDLIREWREVGERNDGRIAFFANDSEFGEPSPH